MADLTPEQERDMLRWDMQFTPEQQAILDKSAIKRLKKKLESELRANNECFRFLKELEGKFILFEKQQEMLSDRLHQLENEIVKLKTPG